MTALLTIQCDDYSILLSDRRTSYKTSDGRTHPNTDEYGKSGVVYCVDGIFAYGFTGVAGPGVLKGLRDFKGNSWIVNQIIKAGKPKCSHQEFILKFKMELTQNLHTIPALQSWKPSERRLTVVFVGYFWTDGHIYGRTVVISNFETFDADGNHTPDRFAKPEFQDFVWTQNVPMAKTYFEVKLYGNWRPFTKAQTEAISSLVINGKSREAVVGKAISLLRKGSDTLDAQNNIGKQIDEIFIPHDPRVAPIGKYHTNKPTNQIWVPPRIFMSGDAVTLEPAMVLTASEETQKTGPWLVPKVRMRKPCPCGSGKKYGDCHGGPNSTKEVTIQTTGDPKKV